MNATKLLISSTAALAVVGAIGFVNAQSTDPGTTGNPPPNQQVDQSVPRPADAGTSTNGTMSNATVPSNSGNTDLPTQADRN